MGRMKLQAETAQYLPLAWSAPGQGQRLGSLGGNAEGQPGQVVRRAQSPQHFVKELRVQVVFGVTLRLEACKQPVWRCDKA